VKDAGAKAIALQLDAGYAASFDAFVESVNDALANLSATRFDFLVNNAGNSHRNMPFATATEEELDSIYNVHFKGVFFLTQKLLPLIEDGGRIVNISTVRTRTASPGGAVYASMKGAVEVLSRHLWQRSCVRAGSPSMWLRRARSKPISAAASFATILLSTR
jgi:NAD(P)-dependent dehydrogenase (short-subunit alcohol dehydrogenase family)